MIKESAELWFDLGFYLWIGNFRKASRVSYELDEIKKQSRLAFHLGYILSIFY